MRKQGINLSMIDISYILQYTAVYDKNEYIDGTAKGVKRDPKASLTLKYQRVGELLTLAPMVNRHLLYEANN